MLAKDESALYDHEVLEELLYFAIPRKDTNPIAHALLDMFGSMSGVFNADPKELQSVEGIGEWAAQLIKTVGTCIRRAGRVEGVAVLKSFGDCKKFVAMRFKGRIEENLEIYFLDRSGKVKRILSYTSSDTNKVIARSDEIAGQIAISKPYGILIAHNHINNSVTPSAEDDDCTKKIQMICNLHNVVLWDHLIYADDFYSYKDSGRLDKIRSGLNF